jgi:hypothetical protein
MKKYLLFLLLFCYLFSCCQADAQKLFIDDFTGDFNKWLLVNGSLSYWQIRDEALYATLIQSRKLSTIVPKDEFWQGMEEYDVEFFFKVFDNTDKNFVAGMKDANNFYDFHFYGNELIVEDIRGGLSLHKTIIPFVLEINRNYLMQLSYAEDRISLLADGNLIFSTTDDWLPLSGGGKFGLKISTGGVAHSAAYFDEVKVTEMMPKDVLFKQNDPSWALEIYDTAADWSSKPTMSNWACAVSSVAMILRAYGYHFLPDGQEINPWSLNLWLLEQNDGYVAQGLVNWLAISRLSKILSLKVGESLPKLEFSYFRGQEAENFTVLQEKLMESEGQIAATTGHFFVVDNYLLESNDFVIKDPLFDYTLLSQRPDKIDSLRLFQPSFTDLSYLLLAIPKEMDFSLRTEDGQTDPELQVVSEQIVAGDEKTGAGYKLIYYAKPMTGEINLLLQANLFTRELLSKAKLFIYNQDAELQFVEIQDLVAEEVDLSITKQLMLKINYQKESISEFNLEIIEKTIDEQQLNFLTDLADQSKLDFEEGKLSFYLFYQLNLLIDSLREHLSYFFLLEKFLKFHGLNT